MVRSNIYNVKLEPGKLYNFRVAAVNQGGESFPSETLSALYNPTATNKILIVNNFHRLASPQVVDNDSIQGFDFDQDPGVSYGLTAGWSGKQRVFDIHRMGIESSSGLGYSGNEMAGQFVAGNDFNHTVEHAQAIASGNKYSIASCSSEAILSGRVRQWISSMGWSATMVIPTSTTRPSPQPCRSASSTMPSTAENCL